MMDPSRRIRAVSMLALATAFWGLSFPTMRALALAQPAFVSGGSWFIASLCLVYRFGVAAVLLALWCGRSVRRLTWLESEQGIGLGLFAAGGLLLQMDGLAYTNASASAFLTQCYCVFLPIWVGLRQRRWPSRLTVLSCLLVLAGVAVLAQVNWRSFRLGRGEMETIGASVLFTGQILWLERPKYAGNNVSHFTLVMFLVIALSSVPVAALTAATPGDWLRAYGSPAMLGFLVILIICCTFVGYGLMNLWQRHLPSTEAGLVYCLEPVFASLFALFLPSWLSRAAKVDYANEKLTPSLLIGGALITIANVLLQFPTAAQRQDPRTEPLPNHASKNSSCSSGGNGKHSVQNTSGTQEKAGHGKAARIK